MNDIKKLIRRTRVTEITGLARTQLYERMDAGTFPRPVQYGRVNHWVEAEVLAWVEAQIAERDNASAKRTALGARLTEARRRAREQRAA